MGSSWKHMSYLTANMAMETANLMCSGQKQTFTDVNTCFSLKSKGGQVVSFQNLQINCFVFIAGIHNAALLRYLVLLF